MRKKLTFNDEAAASHHSKHTQSQNILMRLGVTKDPTTAQKIYIGIIICGLVLVFGLLILSNPSAENSQPPRNNLPTSVNT